MGCIRWARGSGAGDGEAMVKRREGGRCMRLQGTEGKSERAWVVCCRVEIDRACQPAPSLGVISFHYL